jgi:hypothetical protein
MIYTQEKGLAGAQNERFEIAAISQEALYSDSPEIVQTHPQHFPV